MNLETRLFTVKGNTITENATNRALVESIARGAYPALVFYDLAPSVSIGRAQHSILDIDLEAVKRSKVALARRDSGGQAVYLDESYLVFSLVGPRSLFGTDLTQLRKKFSVCMADTLKELGVPASFHMPDNVVIERGGAYQTIGNSGQIITSNAILVEGSLRYSHSGFDTMVSMLKTNGHPLHPYKEEIRSALGAIKDYTKAGKEEVKSRLAKNIATVYGLKIYAGRLSEEEAMVAADLAHPIKVEQSLRNDDSYKSRGVCYLFLNGTNLVKGMSQILPYNQPSTAVDSTHTNIGGLQLHAS